MIRRGSESVIYVKMYNLTKKLFLPSKIFLLVITGPVIAPGPKKLDPLFPAALEEARLSLEGDLCRITGMDCGNEKAK